MKRGLFAKYQIAKRGKWIYNAFVLEPETDENAWKALRVYANLIQNENPELYDDLIIWLERTEWLHL